MTELLKEHEKYCFYEITSKQQQKLRGTAPSPGCKIKIEFTRGIIDYGYLFQLPICDSDPSMGDFLYHVPCPDNFDGMDNADPVFGHLNCLLSNRRVKSITIFENTTRQFRNVTRKL